MAIVIGLNLLMRLFRFPEELVEKVSQYEEFYNSSLGQQFSGFIDHTMKQGQRVRLQNFAVNN